MSVIRPSSTALRTSSSVIGTTVEWYNFLIYGTATALVFNKLFFPSFDPLVGTIAAFGSYAVGFLAQGASLSLATVGKGSTSFTGVQVGLAKAALLGVPGLDLEVTNAQVRVNATTGAAGQRIDWDSATTEPATPSNLLPAMDVDMTQQVSVRGSASLNLGEGVVVAVVNGFAMEMTRADVVTGNDALGTLGTLQAANVLSMSLSDASLFVGVGGAFNGDRSGVQAGAGAVGFLLPLAPQAYLAALAGIVGVNEVLHR